jgi:hypothetical protein
MNKSTLALAGALLVGGGWCAQPRWLAHRLLHAEDDRSAAILALEASQDAAALDLLVAGLPTATGLQQLRVAEALVRAGDLRAPPICLALLDQPGLIGEEAWTLLHSAVVFPEEGPAPTWRPGSGAAERDAWAAGRTGVQVRPGDSVVDRFVLPPTPTPPRD